MRKKPACAYVVFQFAFRHFLSPRPSQFASGGVGPGTRLRTIYPFFLTKQFYPPPAPVTSLATHLPGSSAEIHMALEPFQFAGEQLCGGNPEQIPGRSRFGSHGEERKDADRNTQSLVVHVQSLILSRIHGCVSATCTIT